MGPFGIKRKETINILTAKASIFGDITVTENSNGLIIFAHGSGSSRFSPRNKLVSSELNKAGFSTLLIDLLTKTEEKDDALTGQFRFNIDLLAERLLNATGWAKRDESTRNLEVGYFGASTGAAAALKACTKIDYIKAVVSRGGRPDLTGKEISEVLCPTLLIVGEKDSLVIKLNEEAYKKMPCEKKLEIIPAATHFFDEPGALEKVAGLTKEWFIKWFELKSNIEACAYGTMTIDGKTYNKDLIVFPDKIMPNWWRKEGHLLDIEDLSEALKEKPEVLVIGTGIPGYLSVPQNTMRALKEKNIEVIEKQTDKAAESFNEQLKLKKKVVGVFHLTC